MTLLKPAVLEIRNIGKRFDTTQALDGVSFDVYPGEIHALLGENGAGKSTLIKILTGIHQPDQGEVVLDGRPITIASAVEAQAYGIAAIYQEPMIFPDLSVAENIFISHRAQNLFIRWSSMYRAAEVILAKLGVYLDVRQPARGLTLAAQQAVEIAKAISLKVRVLIMDEPTASLSANEVTQLFNLVATLRERGVAILFISHRMEEVFEISDRVTVLRDGKKISSLPRADVTSDGAIRDMVGRKLEEFFFKSYAQPGKLLLSVRGLQKAGVFADISFDVHRGEILGFAGLVGSRRTDVGLALFGIELADSGEVIFDGKRVEVHSPDQMLQIGIAYVTEDRRGLGLTMSMSVASNISLPTLRNYLSRFGLIKRLQEDLAAERARERLAIRAASVRVEVAQLSGGNQQKVLLSKWLNAGPQLLVLDEPTRGIDVGAKAEVHQMINDLVTQGLGVILISSDLPEVLAMSDRILVMREGRQTGLFTRSEATQEKVLGAAMGQAMSGLGGR